MKKNLPEKRRAPDDAQCQDIAAYSRLNDRISDVGAPASGIIAEGKGPGIGAQSHGSLGSLLQGDAEGLRFPIRELSGLSPGFPIR